MIKHLRSLTSTRSVLLRYDVLDALPLPDGTKAAMRARKPPVLLNLAGERGATRHFTSGSDEEYPIKLYSKYTQQSEICMSYYSCRDQRSTGS